MPINVIYISDLLKLRIRIKGIVSKLNLSESLEIVCYLNTAFYFK